MRNKKLRSFPLGLAVAAVAATMFVDSLAVAAEGRVRRSASAISSPVVSDPTPVASTPAPEICYETVLEPAPVSTAPAATSGRVRRSIAEPIPSTTVSSGWVEKQVQVPCPVTSTPAPGLLTEPTVPVIPPTLEVATPQQIACVPEPSVLALFGAGVAGIMFSRKRRRS